MGLSDLICFGKTVCVIAGLTGMAVVKPKALSGLRDGQ
jgi:hypothetical protein